MTTITLKTTGMHCPSCPMLIELSLRDLPGVGEVEVSAARSQTVVTYDESVIAPEAIINEMRNAGYGAERAA